jgi:hypothetical protein
MGRVGNFSCAWMVPTEIKERIAVTAKKMHRGFLRISVSSFCACRGDHAKGVTKRVINRPYHYSIGWKPL